MAHKPARGVTHLLRDYLRLPRSRAIVPFHMNKKTAGLSLLLTMQLLAGAFGQTTVPAASPKAISPSPQPSASGPVVKVKIVVGCDEATIRTLVEDSFRTALSKSKDVTVLNGRGSAALIIGVKLVRVTGVQAKSPLYAMELSLFDTPALFNALETAGLSRQVIHTLLVANEVQPIREQNTLTVVSKDEIPAKIQSFIPEIETRGVQRARMAMTLNQQRKPGTEIDTGSVHEEVP
jgi:hypothetical protein